MLADNNIIQTSTIAPFVNLALQQNYIPIIKEIILENKNEETVKNIKIHIAADQEFMLPWEYKIEELTIEQKLSINKIAITILPQFLATLSEKITANITINIYSNEDLISTEVFPIDVLAIDQWSGINILPELLATFVTPNNSNIPAIIIHASRLLNKWTGDPSFNDYQTNNPDRVKLQMAAIFEVILEKQFVYCSVPASFEQSGQRVRLVDALLSQKLGNCLDMSLLYASCLEAVGLRSLLVIIHGHIFSGAWLIEETFADAVNDDISLLTKRTADGIKEILLVECTAMNAGSKATFDEAIGLANAHLLKTEKFVLFLDVKRARFSGIKPLPIKRKENQEWEIIENESAARQTFIPNSIGEVYKVRDAEKIDTTKQQLWERKLLDLSLRNSLLNIRMTKSIAQFISVDINKVEDMLSDGVEFKILPKPKDWDNPFQNTGIYQQINAADPIQELVNNELSQKRLRTYYSENELQNSMTHIYRTARLAIEENGASTLYLAVGLLKWYESNVSERPRYSPILLVPVELVRKSANSGFTLRTREDETIVNITLLEMLRQDFGISIGGLEQLPMDESGVDVKSVLATFRRAVMAKNRWDVEEQILLGIFSFSKFILWNDISNNSDKLIKNEIVHSLVSGKLEWNQEITDEDEKVNWDKTIKPNDLALPIPHDVTQLDAIYAAHQNQSFVLHGPPGTGKSQTISNIIANALYHGKKVLFVAAKKAALDVVYKRLEDIGLQDFCLELHSNKAKKLEVLSQLQKALESIKLKGPETFEFDAERIYNLRAELDMYVEALHENHQFGFSLFECFSKYGVLPQDIKEAFTFSNVTIETLTQFKLVEWEDIITQIQSIGNNCGSSFQHPLGQIRIDQYSTQSKNEIEELMSQYLQLIGNLKIDINRVEQSLFLANILDDSSKISSLKELLETIATLGDVPGSLINVAHPKQTYEQIRNWIKIGIVRDQLNNEIDLVFNNSIYTQDSEQHIQDWKIAENSWFLPKWMKQNKIKKIISTHSKSGKISKEETLHYLVLLQNFKEKRDFALQSKEEIAHIGFLWNKGQCNWNSLLENINILERIQPLILNLNSYENTITWKRKISEVTTEGTTAYLKPKEQLFESIIQKINEKKILEQKLKNLAGFELKDNQSSKDWIQDVSEEINAAKSNLHLLKEWYNWLMIKQQAMDAGLHEFIKAYESGAFPYTIITVQYHKCLYRSIAERLIALSPALATFTTSIFEEKIERFKDISKHYLSLTQQEIYARLAIQIPFTSQEASQSSEIGFLQRAIRNNGRALSIRRLFDQIQNLLFRLKPCMLMSPISVAQYFEADTSKFDLVIFDEASQLPTCEAIGALARAKNAIIVGDPKQMPPTSFFSTNKIDEDNIEIEDLESILDDALALSIPSKYLSRHYRSKHESLISFSNANYYDNKLLTFPSPDDLNSKVTLVPVSGYYDKGKTRQNKFEADAIIQEIKQRLSDAELRHRSIGVVTFSVAQQSLIEDKLTELFSEFPELEEFGLHGNEPIFIKNLENVQGDERDIILFSIGYGPDIEGKLSLNFGPLNREGGWRRLNVAVTRARYSMKVFSTLKSDQIDLNRTAAKGVAGLKAFLAYAEKGVSALLIDPLIQKNRPQGIEGLIAKEIELKGYQVKTAIGTSDFKIDIGVMDPQQEGRYLLAIILDGKGYFESQTANDREVVMTGVLNNLGWNIHRVWSAEWWENKEKVLEKILVAIQNAEQNNTVTPTKKVIEPLAETKIEPTIPAEVNLNNSSMNAYFQGYNHLVIRDAITQAIPYELSHLSIPQFNGTDNLLSFQNQNLLQNQIKEVLEMEAPISLNLLTKRILQAWGIGRAGSRIQNYLNSVLGEMNIPFTEQNTSYFYWKNQVDAQKLNNYRVSNNDAEKRNAEDIAVEEIAVAVKEIVENQISLTLIDLIRETARIFGFSRLGNNVETAMKLGIDFAISNNMVLQDGERIKTLR